jgi:hypothetical protein
MGAFSLWHWIVVLLVLFFYGVPMARIIHRTDHGWWWVILFFVPVLNIIAIWVLAFVPWPTVEGRKPNG